MRHCVFTKNYQVICLSQLYSHYTSCFNYIFLVFLEVFSLVYKEFKIYVNLVCSDGNSKRITINKTSYSVTTPKMKFCSFFFINCTEKGFQNVQFHVRANLSNYTPYEIKQIQETVAVIVGCNSTEIVVSGYHHSSSFLVDLSIEKKHVRKLLTMKQQEKDKLRRLNIDYFIVDFSTVYLDMPEGK